MNRPVHFEMEADEPERAAKFYSAVFGWEFQKWEGPLEHWLITTGADDAPGINGGMGRRERPIEGEGIIAYTWPFEGRPARKSTRPRDPCMPRLCARLGLHPLDLTIYANLS